MNEMYVVPTILCFIMSITCLIIGIFFTIAAWNTVLWIWGPALIGFGIAMGVGGFEMKKSINE